MDREYYVYILANKRRGTLYVGVTNDLKRRVYEHRQGIIEGFSKEHKIHQLVFFEQTRDINSAIAREKRFKKWNRQWKIELIESKNSDWDDLYEKI